MLSEELKVMQAISKQLDKLQSEESRKRVFDFLRHSESQRSLAFANHAAADESISQSEPADFN